MWGFDLVGKQQEAPNRTQRPKERPEDITEWERVRGSWEGMERKRCKMARHQSSIEDTR